jgi:hypothetical protein
MKIFRRHNCTQTHPTWNDFAQCVWPNAIWVQGEGQYASVAYCNTTTVVLKRTLEEARTAKQAIDRDGCGTRCTQRHTLVLIDQAATEAAS